MLDKEFKTKWVAALRSGKYKQGQGCLRQESKETGEEYYCCLGVAYDLVAPKGWSKGEVAHNEYNRYYTRDGSAGMYYPTGLTDDQTLKLARMNDIFNATFQKIADYIEKEF